MMQDQIHCNQKNENLIYLNKQKARLSFFFFAMVGTIFLEDRGKRGRKGKTHYLNSSACHRRIRVSPP
jgi:hypothetical protein